MGQVMSMQEIRDRFAGEWVLIGYEDLDDDLNVLGGEVLAHSVHREDLSLGKTEPVVAVEGSGWGKQWPSIGASIAT